MDKSYWLLPVVSMGYDMLCSSNAPYRFIIIQMAQKSSSASARGLYLKDKRIQFLNNFIPFHVLGIRPVFV